MSWQAWEDPRTVLSRHRLRPQKRFSQNFLISPHVVENIAQTVRPSRGERVIEIGPGAGTLTAALLRAGANVCAIERDPAMRALLAAEFGDADGRLEVVDGDAAELDLRALTNEPVALCGNLPYSISGAIFRRLVEQREWISRAVVMVQKEVAERLSANETSRAYGALSVFVGAGYEVDLAIRVKAGSFHPAPKVDSAVVRLDPRNEALADAADPTFVAVVKAAFGQRRKTLNNALKGVAGGREALVTAGIDSKRRGETLSIGEFAAIAAKCDSILRENAIE